MSMAENAFVKNIYSGNYQIAYKRLRLFNKLYNPVVFNHRHAELGRVSLCTKKLMCLLCCHRNF